MALEGVRVGPLDPDKGETFGQVGGQNAARQLIRHHAAAHPPALVQALSGKHNPERSQTLDREEVAKAAVDYYADTDSPLPEGAVITGANVNGADDNPDRRFACFTWVVPVENGGSGRSGKGFIPYTEELLPKSFEAGDEAKRIADLKEAGLPWEPKSVAQRESAATDRNAKEADELAERVQQLEAELAAARANSARISEEAEAAARAQAELSQGGGTAVPSDPAAADAPEAEPEVPWDGYDDENADDIRKRIRSNQDVAEAEKVAAYERKHGKRKSVVGAAEQLLDRPPAE